jgi:DNA processing protein
MPQPTDFVALSFLPSRWRPEIAARLRGGHDPREVLDALLAERPHDASLTPPSLRSRAAAAIERAHRASISVVSWDDVAYPAMLAAIVDPPTVIWIRGDRAALDPPAVAIVGSRAGSPYALAVAERLAADLVSHGLAVVSGLARGVDSAAHRGAVAGSGRTIAVLGSGVDVIYPSEHAGLAGEMVARGALVSELAPGTRPLAHFFPLRNRIISGLSRAVVVIEAGEQSGSLITARAALEQGRDVLAVPGNVLNGRNRGGHALLKDGAKIVETADDILEELGFAARGSGGSRTHADAALDPILGCLPCGDCCDLDTIAERSGLSVARLLPRLCELELRGLVRRAGGGRFIRFDSPC